MAKIRIGTTYSHRQISWLGLDRNNSLKELLAFGFDIVRLAIYWSESEESPGDYDFYAVKNLLEDCERTGLDVILTVGVKAPRWPEFYFPSWLKTRDFNRLEKPVTDFITAAVNALGNYRCIKYWQVENEPLDPYGSDLIIPADFLQKEIALVKKLDPQRPVIVTLWANEMTRRKTMSFIEPYADIIGWDIYYRVPSRWRFYRGPEKSNRELARLCITCKKNIWITELQAEPWEKQELKTLTKETPSMSPEILFNNWQQAQSIGAKTILLWGFEYWLWKKQQGDMRLWMAAKNLLM